VTQLEELLAKLSMFLHPHHYHLYSVKHSLVQLYGHQQGYQINQLSDQQLKRKAGMYQLLLTVRQERSVQESILCLCICDLCRGSF
jgi:hypothetical protein